MSLADDLLELAKKMANYKRTDVLDARLRRAISTAYYALFHLLLEAGSARMVAHAGVRQLVSRAYVHADLYKATKSFMSGSGGLPAHLKAPFGGASPHIPPEIVVVATALVELQEARHEADYDLSKRFTRAETQRLVGLADKAFAGWRIASATPLFTDVCDLFLISLLLCDRLKK